MHSENLKNQANFHTFWQKKTSFIPEFSFLCVSEVVQYQPAKGLSVLFLHLRTQHFFPRVIICSDTDLSVLITLH